MSIERVVMTFAGSMITLSILLAWFISPMWMLLALFVGLNLLQASFTSFCPLAKLLRKTGLDNGTVFS